MLVAHTRSAGQATALLCSALLSLAPTVVAQERGPQWEGVPPVTVADTTLLHTANEPNILVRVIVRGLNDASSFAFLPGGDILVTEKEGRLRVIHDGVLDPTPIDGIPPVRHGLYSGLSEVALHPDFVRNRLIYLTYATADRQPRVALARARFERRALSDFEMIFETVGLPVAESGSRLLFASDGSLFPTVGGAFLGRGSRAQDPQDHGGKILRLSDDGTAPSDNPFVDDPGYLPEIYSMGHRDRWASPFIR